jgi:hypothetical protein
MKAKFPNEIYLKIEHDGLDEYIIVEDQMPLHNPGETTRVGRYRLEQVIYLSKQSMKLS